MDLRQWFSMRLSRRRAIRNLRHTCRRWPLNRCRYICSQQSNCRKVCKQYQPNQPYPYCVSGKSLFRQLFWLLSTGWSFWSSFELFTARWQRWDSHSPTCSLTNHDRSLTYLAIHSQRMELWNYGWFLYHRWLDRAQLL